MGNLDALIGPVLILLAGMILTVMVKKLAGDWLPSIFHKGRLSQILEEVDKVYAPKLEEIHTKIGKTKTDLDEAFTTIREYEGEMNALERMHSERITRLETLREEDKSLIREVKDSVTRLEEKIDSRITRLEDRMSASHKEVISVLKTMSLNLTSREDD